MNRTTNRGRSLSLALLTALLVALAGSGLAKDAPNLVGTVNVNTATVEELQLLPGIGEARAAAVVALRKKRGGFKSVDELVEVRGIGDTAMEKLRPFVRIQGKTTAQRK